MTEPQPINLQTAGAELSSSALRAWILLMDASQEDLKSKQRAAHMLGYTRQHSNRIWRELVGKGYIKVEPGPQNFTATRIVLAKVSSTNEEQKSYRNKKVTGTKKLQEQKSSTEHKSSCNKNVPRNISAPPDSNPPSKQPPTQNTPQPKAPGNDPSPVEINNNSKAATPKTERAVPRRRKVLFPTAENIEVKNSPGEAVPVGGSGGGSIQDLVLTEDSDQLKDPLLTPRYTARRAALTRARETENQENSSPGDNKKASPAINLDKFRLAAAASKAKRSERNKAARQQSRTAPPSGDDLGLEQDDELLGATFDPGPKQRARMVEVLARLPGDAERRKLARELGHHFRRIYTKYRRRYQPGYQFGPKQDRFAERAATLCVLHEVKPADLIAYWTEHVGDFTDMKYPSLSFLSSPGNVDKVACLRAPPGGGGKKQEKPGKPCEVDSTHSYADTSRLNPRLRPGLLEAGYDLTGISDRYLMTVQGAAEAVAGDFPKMYISGKMKPWVDWAAEHIYREAAAGGG